MTCRNREIPQDLPGPRHAGRAPPSPLICCHRSPSLLLSRSPLNEPGTSRPLHAYLTDHDHHDLPQ